MVKIGFYIWALVALAMVLPLMNFSGQRRKLFTIYTLLIVIWLIYVISISQSGVLADFSLPPRVPLFIVFPALILIIFLTGQSSFREVLQQTPRHLPVYMQSFRIVVELLIYGGFTEGVFPEKATFNGLNYDILVGISAPVIAFLYQRRKLPTMGLLIWNILALLVLALTVYSFVSSYYFSDYVKTTGSTDFIKLPYLLLAAVLLPMALFLHVFSLRQLRKG